MTALVLRARMRGRTERLPRPETRPRITAGAVLAPLGAFIALIMLWQAVAGAELVPSDILPPPTRVVGAAAAERDALLRHTAPTLLATLLGFALSVTVAFVTATVLDFSRALRRAILPLLIVSQTLPLIALAPLVVLRSEERRIGKG